jgi:hypothetical protein
MRFEQSNHPLTVEPCVLRNMRREMPYLGSKFGLETLLRDSSKDAFCSVPNVRERSDDAPQTRRRGSVFERYLGIENALYFPILKGPSARASKDAGPQYGVLLYWSSRMFLNVHGRKRLSDDRNSKLCERRALTVRCNVRCLSMSFSSFRCQRGLCVLPSIVPSGLAK